MRPWAFITPASRGIGLALTRRILQTTNIPIVATARRNLDQTKENILQNLQGVDESRLTVVELEVTSSLSSALFILTIQLLTDLGEPSVESAVSTISKSLPKDSHYLHLAFAIPGILYPEKSPAQINYDDALQTFKVNALGPLLLIKHFSPFLPTRSVQFLPEEDADDYKGLNNNHATWATMSARVGSISDNTLGGWYSYRSSKAAVTQIAKTFDNYLKTASGDQAMSVALHPGTVKTGLSKEFWNSVKKEKLFTPEFAAERLLELCTKEKNGGGIGIEGRGRLWDWNGKEIMP
jgi:NAD(P)-dependent dehydrogenase (short-subunit alcohol dehydrogenase family)